jgi:glycogen debranching enzyme
VIERAGADLAALTTATDYGLVPLAGVPWFATVFGRDSLLAAYQALPVAPALARGTLRYLAAHRGTTTDDAREEAPGKILHERRTGELARRGLIPHTPYYGSIDATPLWVVVLAETWRFTRDDALVEALAEPLDDALGWIEATRSDHGADPFLYYEASPTSGMEHKAWRDTPGSVQFPDGREAEPPIASVEVQGYVYRALRDAAMLYEEVLAETDRAGALRERAEDLADAFRAEFWIPETGYYAAAKAGDGRLVPTRTSNVGHCLLSGIVPERRAASVAETLRSPAVFTGWGLRTMATTAEGYSPLSYHLGSVWPHDTALAALGLARYGFHEDADRLARGIVDSVTRLADGRIPELFCGFDDDIDPKPYPASCVPQAWSAAAPFALVRATFDLSPDETGVTTGRTPPLFADSAADPIRDYWTHD